MIYNVSKKSELLFAFMVLFMFSSSLYAAAAKPDLAFDLNQTYSKKDTTVSDANIIQFKVINAWVWNIFKTSNSFFYARCRDKDSKIISEDKYKWSMNSVITKKVFVKKTNFPVTCKIDWENKIAETNENNNIFTFNFVSSSTTNTAKPDLILQSVVLDPNYPTPKVNDENIYLKFTIKNLANSVTFSSGNKWIFWCNEMSNGKFLISKEIKSWSLGKNESITFDVTNIPDPKIYLIPPQNWWQYKLNCRFLLSSNNEFPIDENNYKTFSFNAAPKDPENLSKPDLELISLSLDPNYTNPKVNDEHIYLKFTVKNTWKSVSFDQENTMFSFTCTTANNIRIISKTVSNWNIDKNATLTFDWVTNYPDPNVYLIPPQNWWQYKLNCKVMLNSNITSEAIIDNKNYKEISFEVK